MNDVPFRELKRRLPSIRRNVPLTRRNSFRIRSSAEYFIAPADEAMCVNALSAAHDLGIAVHILGGGTNVLLSDGSIHGLVIHLGRLRHIRFDGTAMTVGAGVQISRLSYLCARRSLAGLAFAYGLPGTVGGAVCMNARCYGGEIADTLRSVRYIDNDRTVKTIERSVMTLAYKATPFQNGRIVLEAVFELKTGDKRTLQREMKKNMNDRRKKQHFRFPSAGSIFLNDYSIGIPSGKIIDEAGLLGMREGGAQVAPYHGNFIINRRHATARDVSVLIRRIQDAVKEKRSITLTPEVRFMGDWNERADR